jgi:hypothetical protein
VLFGGREDVSEHGGASTRSMWHERGRMRLKVRRRPGHDGQ